MSITYICNILNLHNSFLILTISFVGIFTYMERNYTEISLTYKVGEELLVKASKIKEAQLKRVTTKEGKSEWFVDKPLEVISEAEYSQATQIVRLGKEFIEEALSKPEMPKYIKSHGQKLKWFKTFKGQLRKNWTKLSIEDKIDLAIKDYLLNFDVNNIRDYSYSLS